MEISPKMIVKQINFLDATAFERWNASNLQGFTANLAGDVSIDFEVRKHPEVFKGVGHIKITLKGDDKYDIKLFKFRNRTKAQMRKILEKDEVSERNIINVFDEKNNVTVDKLVETIDKMLKTK